MCLGNTSNRTKKSFALEDSNKGDWNMNVDKYVCDKLTLEVWEFNRVGFREDLFLLFFQTHIFFGFCCPYDIDFST